MSARPSKLFKSGVKSVYEKALAAASVRQQARHHRLAPGVHQHLIADRRRHHPTPKKVLKKVCMKAARSVFICSVIS